MFCTALARLALIGWFSIVLLAASFSKWQGFTLNSQNKSRYVVTYNGFFFANANATVLKIYVSIRD